jgi:hypothetical protein
MTSYRFWVSRAILGLVAVTTAAEVQAQDAQEHAVFVRLAEAIPGGFDAAATALEGAFATSRWQVVAAHDAGVDEDDCTYRTRVLTVTNNEYSEALLVHGWLGAFAVPVRLAVFEDENGIQVTAMNPLSLNRTIVDESALTALSGESLAELKEIVAGAFPHNVTQVEYGQVRERGLIGRTMGIMAGGPFPGKVEEITSVRVDGPDGLAETAEQLYSGLEDLGGSRRWGIRPVYRLDLSSHGIVIIGVTGQPMEAKAFDIVGSGGNESRKDFSCPGTDHAPAFPIELVLKTDGDRVHVYLIDEMFRMKMYFEDAGKMKFAANMRMPGSIENEIRDKVEESLF